MTQSELIAEIKKGPSGKYFFFGAEEYLKRFYVGRIKAKTLTGDETVDSFNHYVLKTDECSAEDVENALSSPAMMADRTFVEIYMDYSKQKTADKILELVEFADDSACVVVVVCENFDGGKKNKPSAAAKRLEKFMKLVAFESQTPGELRKWMARRFSADGLKITTECADEIISYSGRDMSLLSGELDKLAAAALARGMESISEELVHEICIKGSEDDAFALANAVMNGDRSVALRELAAARKRRDAAPMVLGSVSRQMSDMLAVAILFGDGLDKTEISKRLKIHEYKVGLIIAAVKDMEIGRLSAALERCREADVLLKTSKLDYIALERLVCTIPAKRKRVGGR